MDFRFTKEQEAWRQEVRQFLKENPAEKFPIEGVDEGYGCGATSDKFGRLLGSKGWISMTWPKEYGGQGRPLMDVLILLEEMAYARAPWYGVLFNFTTGNMLIKIGSAELKKELLPGVARGEECFWLAMSEPDAGSDLLSLRTQAVEKEDCWVVNGQKTWASLADLARLGLLYTKTETDPNISKAKTITMFLLDKNLPGVTVRPLINLAGDITHNEVFLDDVRIPKKYLLGQKNKGFIHMLEGLDFDRFWGRFIKPPFCKSVIEDLVRYAKETRRDGAILANDPMVRHKLAESAIETEACRVIFWNAGWKMCNGLPFSMDSAMGKIMADEMGQRLFHKGTQIMGSYSQLGEATKWAPLRAEIQKWYLSSLGHTIAGGTSEIIRNTIATVGLGLPR
jgi:hypothetical protein